MNEKAEDPVRSTGPAVRWRTGSRETRPLSSETMVLTLAESTSGLTLKRTTCSTAVDMADLTESDDLRLRGKRLGVEKVWGNEVERSGRALKHNIGVECRWILSQTAPFQN